MSTELQIGDVSVARVEEMHGPIMPAADFFPDIPAQAWVDARDSLVPDHLDPDGMVVRGAFQTWVVRSAGRTILIDTGVGNDKVRPGMPAWDHLSSSYLDNLAAAGVKPADVDLVVNTHLHLDHIGWNTRLVDGGWQPTFPNARYLMSRADFEHWNPAVNPAIAGSMDDGAYVDSVAPVAAAGQVDLWEGAHVIDENLRLEAAPGHTPGASVVTLASDGRAALFAGDLLHSPLQVSQHVHNSCFDGDPATARSTRRRLLARAAEQHALVLPAHLAGSSAFEVVDGPRGLTISAWAPLERY